MNVKYLKDNNLMEAHKQFMRLCEWSYIPESLNEEDPNADPNAQGGAPDGQDPMGGGAPGGADPMGGGDPNAQGGAPDGQDPMGGGAPDGADPMGGEDNFGLNSGQSDDEKTSEEDEVIDVDDITNAQEEVFDRVNKVGKNLGKMDDKFTHLMNSLDSMIQKIDSQNAEIENLKQEFSKRNPTPTEKLNLRSLDSYPYNVRPTEYWREKSATSNYAPFGDDMEEEPDEYKITDADIDDFDDRDIADSFYVDDDMRQDLKKIFEM